MKYTSFIILLAAISFSSCEKEQNRELLNAYLKYTVNGQEATINDGAGINDNTFECIISGDSVLRIRATKRYEEVGFYLRNSSIKNGTYTLDSINTGYYVNPVDYRRYSTNNAFQGTLTISRGTFQASSVLNTLQGQFSFTGEDTMTHRQINVSNGSFFMERQEE